MDPWRRPRECHVWDEVPQKLDRVPRRVRRVAHRRNVPLVRVPVRVRGPCGERELVPLPKSVRQRVVRWP